MKQPIKRVESYFQNLSPQSLEFIEDSYHEDVVFSDPLNEAVGVDRLKEVFNHMFDQLSDVKITCLDGAGNQSTGFLLWEMTYTFRQKPRTIQGTSHFRFSTDGRVLEQRDYWDASFAVYGEFPVMGLLMKGIRRVVRSK